MMRRGLWVCGAWLMVMGLACGDGGLFAESGGTPSNASSSDSGTTSATSGGGEGGDGGAASAGSGSGGDPSTSSAEASSSQMSSAEMSSSSTGMMSICDPDPNDQACMMCIRGQCCPELMNCDNDQNCDCWLSCLLDGGSQFQCFQMCGQPGAVWDGLVQCAEINCGPQCS